MKKNWYINFKVGTGAGAGAVFPNMAHQSRSRIKIIRLRHPALDKCLGYFLHYIYSKKDFASDFHIYSVAIFFSILKIFSILQYLEIGASVFSVNTEYSVFENFIQYFSVFGNFHDSVFSLFLKFQKILHK